MIADELLQIASQEQEEQKHFKHHIFACSGTACLSAHSDQIQTALEKEVEERGLGNVCAITGGGCRGLCASATRNGSKPTSR
jgi:NADH:ubiquinone oxidoreductase subunit E